MKKMPVLFVGHGSPMMGLEENDFTRALQALGRRLPRPKAIAVASAHWVTPGTRIATQPAPKQIYDFYGFPEELYRVKYQVPGAPEEAKRLAQDPGFLADESWGIDHGTWTVLKHLFPKADIPTFQVSLDQGKDLTGHLDLGRSLAHLRDEGVLLIGSGNLTHNLRDLSFDEDAEPFDWAVEFDAKAKQAIDRRDGEALTHPQRWGGTLFRKAHPTVEHYVPLLYALGASGGKDEMTYPFEGIKNGSISMRAVLFQ